MNSMTRGNGARETRGRGQVPALLFALVWLSCTWFGSWAFNPNSATRLLAATAIVEHGDARIDSFADMTIDKARFDGHVYMDKAPGMTLMALPWVALANAITHQTSADVPHRLFDPAAEDFLRLRMRVAIAFSNAILTALAATALLQFGTGITGNRAAGLFAAIGFALGTTMWGWSTTYFGHAPATALIAIALWAVWRGTSGGGPGRHALIAGLALGWAVVIEHSAILTGAPVALWALWRIRGWEPRRVGRIIVLALAGGIATSIPLFAYNLAVFGHPFQTGYAGVVGFEGMQQGLFGLTYPKPDILWEILGGKRRGMVWVAPVLVLAPFGIRSLLRDPKTRDIGVIAAAGATVAFLYHAAYVYWDGGNSTGPRHALPAIAYLAIGLAAFWASANRVEKWLGGGFLAVSVALNLAIAAADIHAPHVYAAPVTQHIIPKFLDGDIRTLPGEFWSWSPRAGLGLYLALAGLLIGLLARAWVRERQAPETV
jgi:4-amino-4-deoxy-L-arabinose transferase-like glycosyltransferase